jgi:hypothetical protein
MKSLSATAASNVVSNVIVFASAIEEIVPNAV